MVEARGLIKKYSGMEREVLSEADLKIDNGEFIALTGPSGSGKTTLLNILSGIIKPNKGNIIFDDINICNLSEKKRNDFRLYNMGFVFQGYYLLPTLNVYDNIILPTLASGKDIKRESVLEIISKLGLEEKIYNYPFQLSGGEQQRVAIGRALLNKPKIIFADEPTGNLDYENSIKVMNILKNATKDYNTTVFFVTHDMSMVKFSDKHYKLNQGKIIYAE